jgi:AAA+ ATPase superfamily predicted ATPase
MIEVKLNMNNELQKELENNYRAFEKLLPSYQSMDNGRFVLLRHENQINIFDSARDAVIYANAQFPDGIYSVQQITRKIVDLGYFSHAVPNVSI